MLIYKIAHLVYIANHGFFSLHAKKNSIRKCVDENTTLVL